MDIMLPNQVKTALNILKEYKAYIVGGCVRDSLLNLSVSDYDIATDADPQSVKMLFCNFKVIETGIKHGTVTVIIDSMPIEITTFRTEEKYENYRKPKSVNFVKTLKEDVSRRDFTINAIAYNQKEGIVDYYDGVSDINKKLIRCVGIPNERFSEDALRILRALRFASTLGFSIEQNTKESILKNFHLLTNISKERITAEFLKLICGKNAAQIISEYKNVISEFIPVTNKINLINKLKPIKHLRLAALLYELSADTAKKVLTNLRFDNDTISSVYNIIKYKDITITSDKKEIKKNLYKLGEKTFLDLAELKEQNDAANTANEIINNNECYNLKNLNITGNDLINLGLPAGKIIADTLETLLYEVIDEKLKNLKQELLLRAKSIL